MSLLSKGNLSIRKKDVLQQRKGGTAYRRLIFAHKANAGETGVNFTALVQPSEMAALGFTNPSTADILAANILFYKRNLTVISSARGVLIQDLSYTVPTSSRVEFQGFTALQDEIFTFLLETGVKDGLNVVDASPIVATGTLGVGNTDFNVGTPFEVGKYINQQVGAVLVFRDGVIQFRNTSNGTSGGNYQEIDNGSGLGTIIRFNEAPVSEPANIVVWGNLLAERPDGSMMAAIESLAGQVDKMIPTLAALAGVPTTTFQSAPNNQDLKAFGDTVHKILDVEIPFVTNWTDFPSVAAGTLITATTTNPTYGTVEYNRAQWRRVGDYMEIRWIFRQTTGGTNGSGIYLFNLPPGFQIDTSKLSPSLVSAGTGVSDFKASSLGWIQGQDEGGLFHWGPGFAALHSATQIKFAFPTQSNSAYGRGFWGSTYGPFTIAPVSIEVFISVPIVGWAPTRKIRDLI